MNKKYKLTNKSIEVWGKKLFQIEAIVSFGSIVKGELGGYIEKEENLAQVSGNAWVSGNAQVSGNAWVFGNAQVSGNAQVFGKFSLTLGYFFGMKYGNEEIKTFKTNDNEEIIYKGDNAKIESYEEKPIESLSGKEVKVTLDGKTYTAIIK